MHQQFVEPPVDQCLAFRDRSGVFEKAVHSGDKRSEHAADVHQNHLRVPPIIEYLPIASINIVIPAEYPEFARPVLE